MAEHQLPKLTVRVRFSSPALLSARPATRSPDRASPWDGPPVARSTQLPTAVRAVLLVEGVSDREAVLAAARGQGRNLSAEGVDVVPMGGASAIRRHLARVAAHGPGVRVAGLYDLAE